jgi:signal transduction histidine kinase
MTLDTARLHRIFREQLQAHRIGTTYQLLAIPIDSTLSPPVGKKLYTEAYTTGLTRGDTKTFAQFENPFITVLRRARWSIFGSLAIISLTAGSFFIMLRIILRQKQLAQIKDDFIDNISHELQTPIATLKAANEGLENITLTKPPKRPNNT